VQRTVLIHYHEINLKKNNRGWFESRLLRHLRILLDEVAPGIEKFGGRMTLPLGEAADIREVERRLRTAFGVANFAIAWETSADFDAIRSGVLELATAASFRTFRIEARRGTKDFPLNSQQLNETLGAAVREATGAAVRLEQPERTFYVEIVGRRAFLYFDKLRGGGGLPTRTGGRVLCLMSGGIDSPVAAWRLMRRGCHVLFTHFHSFPHTTAESQEKVRRLVRILGRYQLGSRLYMVPFAPVQREIVAFAPPALRVILYRRLMVRIGERLAEKEHALALVTGDSLGQVASQTLENLRVVSAATSAPIFRPLIGDDKEDIIRIAREIGTYDVSILPDEDCCTMFVPKHPETMARIEQVEAAEAALDVPRLVRAALDAAVRETVQPDFAQAAPGS
jgi:thiamine biosynthesis protein ThiI